VVRQIRQQRAAALAESAGLLAERELKAAGLLAERELKAAGLLAEVGMA